MTTPPNPGALSPVAARLALEIARSLGEQVSGDQFLETLFPAVLSSVGGHAGGLVRQQDGQWQIVYWHGERAAVPELLIGEAVDRGHTQLSSAWLVTPLPARRGTGWVIDSSGAAAALVLRCENDGEPPSRLRADASSAVELLAAGLSQLEHRDLQRRRIEQLTAVLNAAAEWQQLDDDEALLRRIADTATALLNCERASIFLWDKRRRKLVGRPALGIEGGALEVDDRSGVVGEVLRTQETKFWNRGSDDDSRVNRSVDQSLEFETRSLVAVPMVGPGDELIGVFEGVNHRDDHFGPLDAAVLKDLATHASAAIESLRTRQQLTENRDRLVDDAASSTPLIGRHESIEQVRQQAARVAKTELSVLVLGQNGTGKEVLAKHIHYESRRRNGPFTAVNCAALVETLLESELFGHEKGAFTDANQTRPGKFELAHGGTLFLDEIGDMSPGGQAKLLRVLEDKVIVRVGGSQTLPVDVRVIAATNQPLQALIQERRFREDLFFRLNVVSLTLPPLSERGDDVLWLTEHFLRQFCYEIGRRIPTLTESALSALRRHPWPGNIRELRNTVERLCYLSTDDEISAADLMLSSSGPAVEREVAMVASSDLTSATKEFQIEHITRAIARARGNMTEAAEQLGLHRSNLYRKMRQLGIPTGAD